MGKIFTGDTAREIVGVGAAINLKHGGPTKRPTEEGALKNLDDWSPKTTKTPADFRRERKGKRRKRKREFDVKNYWKVCSRAKRRVNGEGNGLFGEHLRK